MKLKNLQTKIDLEL